MSKSIILGQEDTRKSQVTYVKLKASTFRWLEKCRVKLQAKNQSDMLRQLVEAVEMQDTQFASGELKLEGKSEATYVRFRKATIDWLDSCAERNKISNRSDMIRVIVETLEKNGVEFKA